MARRFPIADLRTLVARALETGHYRPAESGRVRAVPDTRTIRYYTTLGLIDRPAEMRGRTALYDETHVLQLVAIKRLQAQNQTLSDIQSRMVGATNRSLRKLADLPGGFWESADRYLKDRPAAGRKTAETTSVPPPRREATPHDDHQTEAFWAQPAALPGRRAESRSEPRPGRTPGLADTFDAPPVSPTSCVRLSLHPEVQLILDGTMTSGEGTPTIDAARIQAAAKPLLEELLRQGLLKPDTTERDDVTRSSDRSDSSLPQGD